MGFQASKKVILLGLAAAASLCACAASAFSAEKTKVTFKPASEYSAAEAPKQKEDGPAFHRQLWEGTFDTSSDQAGSVAKQLEGGLDFDCMGQFGPIKTDEKKRGRPMDLAGLQECQAREAAAKNYGKEAKSIQSQQKVMSMVSKVSDVAAVAAVGGVIYGELGAKKNNQADTYESAANIQRMAGKASYVTGATDLTLGAYAFVAQKRKLEEMQKNLNGKGASTDNARLNQSLVNAVETTKQAAYSHMLIGAGKMAAGYASMWLAKRSAQQAENMNSLNELNMMNEMAAAQAAATSPTPASVVVATPSTTPYYQNNQPVFMMPSSGFNTGLAPTPNTPSYSGTNGGASSLPSTRSLASNPLAGANKGSGIAGGSGGSGSTASSGASSAPAEEAAEETKAKAHKEALGTFETALSGGMRPFGGSGSSDSGKDETPNLAAMMGLGGQNAAKPAATGLSPTQMYSDALEGTEGTEQGSMAGVNGKSQLSLFAITKEKINKMFQVGNVGMPKNVEVRN